MLSNWGFKLSSSISKQVLKQGTRVMGKQFGIIKVRLIRCSSYWEYTVCTCYMSHHV